MDDAFPFILLWFVFILGGLAGLGLLGFQNIALGLLFLLGMCAGAMLVVIWLLDR